MSETFPAAERYESHEILSSDDDYEVLTVSPRSGETGHELRERYLQLTANLIYHMQGYDEPEMFKPDTVVFLDKSARPVAWMVRKLWSEFARTTDDHGNVVIPEMPEMKFLNIDREQWEHCFEEERKGPNASVYMFKKDRVKQSELEELREVFVLDHDENNDPFEEQALLDDERLLVVDEVKLTGRTMVAAKNLLQLAFKNVEVDGHHWMNPKIRVDLNRGVRYNEESPLWYSEANPRGRGVDNRDSKKNLFLSTRFEEVDESSLMLRRDIEQLADDYVNGKYSVLVGDEIKAKNLRDRQRDY